MLRKSNLLENCGELWRVGTLDCRTLRITYQHLDNTQLTEPQALSIVAQWSASESGRRLSWLVGRANDQPNRR